MAPVQSAVVTSREEGRTAVDLGNPALSLSTSLFVGDLHTCVDEDVLNDLFSPFGSIHSIDLRHSTLTKDRLGYAIVNFDNIGAARGAMRWLNFRLHPGMQGIPIRIMWNSKDPGVRMSKEGNIVVEGLPSSIGNKQLYEKYLEYGEVMSSKVTNKGGKTRGYVQYLSSTEAEAAILATDRTLVEEHNISVRKFPPRWGPDGARSARIYVGGLGNEWNKEETLRELFLSYGEILDIHFPVHRNGCYAFVTLSSAEIAQKAIAEMNGKPRGSRVLSVHHAVREDPTLISVDYRSLFVKGLQRNLTEVDMKVIFEKFGVLNSVEVARRRDGGSMGYGFVAFRTRKEAANAKGAMDGAKVGNKTIICDFTRRERAGAES